MRCEFRGTWKWVPTSLGFLSNVLNYTTRYIKVKEYLIKKKKKIKKKRCLHGRNACFVIIRVPLMIDCQRVRTSVCLSVTTKLLTNSIIIQQLNKTQRTGQLHEQVKWKSWKKKKSWILKKKKLMESNWNDSNWKKKFFFFFGRTSRTGRQLCQRVRGRRVSCESKIIGARSTEKEDEIPPGQMKISAQTS